MNVAAATYGPTDVAIFVVLAVGLTVVIVYPVTLAILNKVNPKGSPEAVAERRRQRKEERRARKRQ